MVFGILEVRNQGKPQKNKQTRKETQQNKKHPSHLKSLRETKLGEAERDNFYLSIIIYFY